MSEGSIYPSTVTSPAHTLTPSHLHPRSPSPCIELPLPRGRLEPGEGVRGTLLLQGTESGEVPLNLVLYYEPALIMASSRIRYMYMHVTCSLIVCVHSVPVYHSRTTPCACMGVASYIMLESIRCPHTCRHFVGHWNSSNVRVDSCWLPTSSTDSWIA